MQTITASNKNANRHIEISAVIFNNPFKFVIKSDIRNIFPLTFLGELKYKNPGVSAPGFFFGSKKAPHLRGFKVIRLKGARYLWHLYTSDIQINSPETQHE